MNDGEKLIDEEIKFIEKELTNLKTAHQRPLGALDFFTKTETISVQLTESFGLYYRDFWIDVEIEPSTVRPPICQTGWDVPTGFRRVETTDFSISSDYTKFSYKFSLWSETVSSASFKVSATSSMPIRSITRRYV